MLSRIANSYAATLNKKDKLPKIVLIVLDDDIIQEFMDVKLGVSSAFGIWLEWLVGTISQMTHDRKEQLPDKAVKTDYPVIFWTAVPHHRNFENAALRTKFNISLNTNVRPFQQMRVIKMKEIWDYNNTIIVSRNRITPEGEIVYWKSVSTSVQYNMEKMFPAYRRQQASEKGPADTEDNRIVIKKKVQKRKHKRSGMNCFEKYQRFHWNKGDKRRN